MAVLVGRCGADDRVNGIAVSQGLLQRFEHHHPRAFAADETIGRSVERFASSLRRKHAGPRKSDETFGRDHHGDTSGQRDRTMSRRELLASDVHRSEGRRAGRVHRDARTGEVEAIRNAVRRYAVRVAGRGVRADARAVAPAALNRLVVVVRDADENAYVRPVLQVEHQPGVFHRFPRRLKEKTLLRIDVGGLARGNAEKLRVELVDPADETAALGDRLSGQPGLRVIEAPDIPAVGRDFRHRLAPLDQKIPEILRVVQVAGKAAAHADNCNVILLHAVGRPFERTVSLARAPRTVQDSDRAGTSPEILWRERNRRSLRAISDDHRVPPRGFGCGVVC